MKICFLLTHIPNPRINKRIDTLRKTADVSVLCVRRLSQDFYEPVQPVPHEIFPSDYPKSERLLKRYLASCSFGRWALKKLEKLQPDVIYAEGLDCLIIAGKYKKQHKLHIVLEVADLREAYTNKPKDPAKRILTELLLLKERREFRHVELLVITSPKFYEVYFHKLIAKDKTVFVPNYPDLTAFADYRKKSAGEFTVGFIGGIRYIEQLKMLVDAAGMAGCRVLFAGGINRAEDEKTLLSYCENRSYVRFTGKYDYDSQIAALYGSVDCIFSVYDRDNLNASILLPNRLYEAVVCELPILAAGKTYLGDVIEQWGVGLTVEHNNAASLCEALKRLRDDRTLYEAVCERCRAMKSSISPEKENARLLQMIREMDSP